MKLRDCEKLNKPESVFTPTEDVRVWQIVELFDKDEKTKQEQHSFVLASDIKQALHIVGSDIYRIRSVSPSK